MEQISEVEAFFGLYTVNPFFHPVDVKGSDGWGVIAYRGIVPGMGPDSNSPALTIVVPSQVNILLGGYGEDGEEFQIPSDLVVRYQAIDIVGVILSFIWWETIV
jgi:hypothetical protein